MTQSSRSSSIGRCAGKMAHRWAKSNNKRGKTLITRLDQEILSAYLRYGQKFRPTCRAMSRPQRQIRAAIAKLEKAGLVPELDPETDRARLCTALDSAKGDLIRTGQLYGVPPAAIEAACICLQIDPAHFGSIYPARLQPNPEAPPCSKCGLSDRVGRKTTKAQPNRWQCYRCDRMFVRRAVKIQ